jgi:GntR family transcriptional regulator / MocR family aminotransferase
MIDLFVDPTKRRQTSAQLFTQIRSAIIERRLLPGDRLPTSRELADQLGVARSTVTTVYSRLVAEGLLDAQVGDGTFVAETAAPATVPPTALAPRRPLTGPVTSSVTAVGVIDLRTGRPDPSLFPLADWKRSVTDALNHPPPGYGNPAGLPELRRVLAVWLHRSRGVNVAADQVVITAGAQQAFDTIARTMLAPGDTIAFENPGYSPARRVFEHHNITIAPVPVDNEGIVVDAIPNDVRAVYVTPSHQLPTGVTMSATRRRALLAFATRNDVVVIEDDYDTEFRHTDRPLEPLQLLDTSGRVIYVGTFSKTLSPSLRIGFVIAPPALTNTMIAARGLVDTQPPHLTQAALATLIARGDFDRHLRRARRVYRARNAAVDAYIRRMHNQGLIQSPPASYAGLHHHITLHHGTDAISVATRLAHNDIIIDTADDNWATQPQPGLLIGFGLADIDNLNRALALLAADLTGQPPKRP